MTAGETHRDGAPPVTWTFPGKYISLTTYRRDGTAVATPVWFAQDGDRLLVRTGEGSGKVKRIHRNPAVGVAACTATGRLRGQEVSGVARVLGGAEASPDLRLINRKYRVSLLIAKALWSVQSALHVGRQRTTPVIVAITRDGLPNRSSEQL